MPQAIGQGLGLIHNLLRLARCFGAFFSKPLVVPVPAWREVYILIRRVWMIQFMRKGRGGPGLIHSFFFEVSKLLDLRVFYPPFVHAAAAVIGVNVGDVEVSQYFFEA